MDSLLWLLENRVPQSLMLDHLMDFDGMVRNPLPNYPSSCDGPDALEDLQMQKNHRNVMHLSMV
jgi:hypothetical protein